jgi:hypothetical protein
VTIDGHMAPDGYRFWKTWKTRNTPPSCLDEWPSILYGCELHRRALTFRRFRNGPAHALIQAAIASDCPNVLKKGPNVLNSLLESLFGCSHRTTTFPLTLSRNIAGQPAAPSYRGAYVVCLECGKEFGYDWHAMRIGDPITPLRAPAQVSLSPANRQSSASGINYSWSKRKSL